MSIINQLLKDLEKRRKKQQGKQDQSLAGLSVNPKRHGGAVNIRLIVLLVIAVIILVLLYFWYYRSPMFAQEKPQELAASFTKKASAKPADKIVAVKPLVSKPKPEAASPQPLKLHQSAILQVPTIETKHDQTALTILSSHLVHYRLTDHQSSGMLTIHFANAEFSGEMALAKNPALASIKAVKTTDGVDLNLQMLPDVKLVKLTPIENPAGLLLLFTHKVIVQETPAPAMQQEKIVPLSQDQKNENAYQAALQQAADSNIPQAVTMLTDLVNKAPAYKDARLSLMKLLLQQNNIATALVVVDQGLKRSPTYIPYIVFRARLFLALGEPEKALNALETVSPDLEANPNYYSTLAVVQQKIGNYLYAAQIYRQLIGLESNKGVWWLGLGVALESSGRYNAAFQAYKHAAASGNLQPALLAYAETQMNQIGE